mmetsp:Transcript_6726/g.19207  ORF Transcript_6726/g.19207 Transcript_6726/m.19207 type:complete len:314 (+) Transcript_6726:386-1327(+)
MFRACVANAVDAWADSSAIIGSALRLRSNASRMIRAVKSTAHCVTLCVRPNAQPAAWEPLRELSRMNSGEPSASRSWGRCLDSGDGTRTDGARDRNFGISSLLWSVAGSPTSSVSGEASPRSVCHLIASSRSSSASFATCAAALTDDVAGEPSPSASALLFRLLSRAASDAAELGESMKESASSSQRLSRCMGDGEAGWPPSSQSCNSAASLSTASLYFCAAWRDDFPDRAERTESNALVKDALECPRLNAGARSAREPVCPFLPDRVVDACDDLMLRALRPSSSASGTPDASCDVAWLVGVAEPEIGPGRGR